MTYNEAEKLALNNKELCYEANGFFKLNNSWYKLIRFIIAPSDSSLQIKQFIYDRCKVGCDNKGIIIDLGFEGYDLNVFLIYLHRGNEIIIPLQSFIQFNEPQL